jgi:hypothetical protein
MSTKGKKNTILDIGNKHLITVDPALPSFENHPFFEKKAQKAKELIRKVGLPKELFTNK